MSEGGRLQIAVVGCGLIGARRAAVATDDRRTRVALTVDTDPAVAAAIAQPLGCAHATDWHAALGGTIDVVIVATPNRYLAEIGIAALAAGKHVLVEKPMGRNLTEARALAVAAGDARRRLKIGFNHRYNPAIADAHARFASGAIGDLINVRARYGHGARPGYEREWRGDAELAGGGELTDQGVHVLDLLEWFAGSPDEVFCMLQRAVWPIAPLEDNGFALLRYGGGRIASVHTSWTQWKNLFSLEVFGTLGSLTVEGLGKSYGPQRLVATRRNPAGGVPESTELAFEEPDRSWHDEWSEFVDAIVAGTPYHGTPQDGMRVMRALDACYRSSRANAVVRLDVADASASC